MAVFLVQRPADLIYSFGVFFAKLMGEYSIVFQDLYLLLRMGVWCHIRRCEDGREFL